MRLLLVVALAAFVASACGGGTKALPPPQSAKAQATRDYSGDGGALLTTTIDVTFDREVAIVDRQVPLASNFELSVQTIRDDRVATDRVLVQSAEHFEDNARRVQLKVNRLVPDGAELRIRRSAFDPKLDGEMTVTVESDMVSPLAVFLASEALFINNGDVIASRGAAQPTEADRDPAAQREALEEHLNARGSDPDAAKRALDAYDNMPPEIVQSPKLAAALAALTGTFAEPAIASLLTGDNCTRAPAVQIAFQEPPDLPDLFARVTYGADGRRIVSVNPTLEGERIEHLMPLLAHEAIHCDRISGRFEEVAATSFDSFLYIQLIAAMPELVSGGTPLTKDLNVDAIAMINSGRALPESIGILPSPGVDTVLPGTTANIPSFGDLVLAAYPSITYNESPNEPLAQAYVSILAPIAGMQPKVAFDLLYLDKLLAQAIDPQVYQAAIVALELGPG